MQKVVLILAALLAFVAPVLAADEPTPGKPVLIVMDVQNAYLPYMDDKDKAVALKNISFAIDLFRAEGFPVIRVHHTDPERGPAPGSDGFTFPETIRVIDSDPQVVKTKPSAFRGTKLDQIVKDLGCDTLFLVGLSATGCVQATYWDAIGLDYRVFMVRHALLSHNTELTRAVEDMTGAVSGQALKYMLTVAPH